MLRGWDGGRHGLGWVRVGFELGKMLWGWTVVCCVGRLDKTILDMITRHKLSQKYKLMMNF